MEEKDFLKLWSANGSVATITDDQYQQGWAHIGDNKPTRAQFNAWQKWSDEKSLWLYLNKLGSRDTAMAAKQLENSRAIKLSGAVKGEARFDGGADITIKTELVGFDSELIKTGWHKDPTGLIVQWGEALVIQETKIQFHKDIKELFGIQVTTVTSGRPGGTNTMNVHVIAPNNKGFSIGKSDNYSSGQVRVFWEAKGK